MQEGGLQLAGWLGLNLQVRALDHHSLVILRHAQSPTCHSLRAAQLPNTMSPSFQSSNPGATPKLLTPLEVWHSLVKNLFGHPSLSQSNNLTTIQQHTGLTEARRHFSRVQVASRRGISISLCTLVVVRAIGR